jgi:hypothetical protein
MARNTTLVKGKPSAEPAPRRRLVVTERGVEGVEAVLEDASFDETLVVANAPADSPTGLTLRLALRVAILERQKRACSSAMILLGRGRDPQRAAAREIVARTLLTHLETAGGGELLLLAPSASAAERDELLAFVEKLLGEIETRSVMIRVQFRSDKARLASEQNDVVSAHSA